MVSCNLSRRLFADTLVKVGDRRAQSSRDFEQSSGGDAIDATLVLVSLLIGYADHLGKLLLGQRGHSLDFSDAEGFRSQHYAFLVSDAEFDAALARIRASGVKHYANFRRERPGEINHLYGGRGVYFDDPNGHLIELITRPYSPIPEGR